MLAPLRGTGNSSPVVNHAPRAAEARRALAPRPRRGFVVGDGQRSCLGLMYVCIYVYICTYECWYLVLGGLGQLASAAFQDFGFNSTGPYEFRPTTTTTIPPCARHAPAIRSRAPFEFAKTPSARRGPCELESRFQFAGRVLGTHRNGLKSHGGFWEFVLSPETSVRIGIRIPIRKDPFAPKGSLRIQTGHGGEWRAHGGRVAGATNHFDDRQPLRS